LILFHKTDGDAQDWGDVSTSGPALGDWRQILRCNPWFTLRVIDSLAATSSRFGGMKHEAAVFDPLRQFLSCA
jgi:hypothetical protein